VKIFVSPVRYSKDILFRQTPLLIDTWRVDFNILSQFFQKWIQFSTLGFHPFSGFSTFVEQNVENFEYPLSTTYSVFLNIEYI